MREYRLSFWNSNRCREGTCAIKADSDHAAYNVGSKMLSDSDCTMLEIWRDTHLLARIGGDGDLAIVQAPDPLASQAAAQPI